MSKPTDTSDRRRRKSAGFFVRPNGRPTSIFGSLRSVHSTEEDDVALDKTTSKSSLGDDEIDGQLHVAGQVVLHHGEVHTTGGVFRKRKEYLVLTDRYLVRFKSQGRAADVFPTIPSSLGRSNTLNGRHGSIPSGGSVQDLQSLNSHSSAEGNMGIPLSQVIAVYKLDDGRPYFSLELAHLDEETNQASSMILLLNDPREADLWLSSLRAAALKARLGSPRSFSQKSVEYAARVLEQERDYDPAHFRIFKVVQRASTKSSGRSSSDDVSKLTSIICYLIIGVHKVHLIPLPRLSHRISSSSLAELNFQSSFGILALTSINIKTADDAFELSFRIPFCRENRLHLASSCSAEIALWLCQATQYLRPQWLQQPINLSAPYEVEDEVLPVNEDDEDHKCFDRTLTAYCAAYDLDTSNVRYTIAYDVEDAPCFELLPPANPRRSKYLALELLAIMRSLRFNESFRSISFRGISLDVLHGLRDYNGTEQVAWTTRSGTPIDLKTAENSSMLVQEIQGLALKSKRLRRLDFSSTITRKPHDSEAGPRDPGCGIAEALFPLCRKQLTNVDWIVLSGIELGESDLDYLVDAAVEKGCHFRALEVSRCGLTDRSMQLILNAMLSQDNTMESIDLSGNLARLSPATFQGQIGHFAFIRRINLSRVQRTSGPEPLIATETLLTWRLESLQLSETAINEQTVASICAYLKSPKSDTLREVCLNQCGLTGTDVAAFMRAMTRNPGTARNLHLHVSENRLEKGHDDLARAVAEGLTPSHLTMKMVEYQREDHFRGLVQALRQNTTLKYLDISKASLPYDANHETCEALQLMFAENQTLEELDISGEHAHLEVAKFGIGLNHALTGLSKNSALKVLHIEYQRLGLQGANTLASVLEHNSTLREIYCEHNDINLQGLTGLVNGLSKNYSVQILPDMARDRAESLQMVEREIQAIRVESSVNTSKSSVRRTLAAVSSKASKSQSPPHVTYTEQDVIAAVKLMNDKWERQTKRLEHFLLRNYCLDNGLPAPMMDSMGVENDRPITSTSISGLLNTVRLDSTPTAEKEVSLGEAMNEKFGLDLSNHSEDVSPSSKDLHV
ncbi:RNI-like protein [Xylona heveae TC161]|uniref:RNI-like protein n=1 Tax=Xylona heveae (strain CBS 132557 / TC161) TaxID=1328760 RepID=A0A165FSF7_XYLHT|nr:RNI-like protein [Xylona heveae TC161]KZF21320.1 RNI-like protein [Xylona heveae TC161]